MAALAALAATPGLAADMLVKKAPPPPRAPAWSWTGFYVGANLGGGWAKTDWFEDVSGSGGGGPPGFQDASVSASSVLGGGQIGFDWQSGWAVFGIQADADAAGIRGSVSCFPQVANTPQSCSIKIDTLGTVTARFGAAFDKTHYYILGGFAWEHERLNNPGMFAGVPFNPSFQEREPGRQWAPDLKRSLPVIGRFLCSTTTSASAGELWCLQRRSLRQRYSGHQHSPKLSARTSTSSRRASITTLIGVARSPRAVDRSTGRAISLSSWPDLIRQSTSLFLASHLRCGCPRQARA